MDHLNHKNNIKVRGKNPKSHFYLKQTKYGKKDEKLKQGFGGAWSHLRSQSYIHIKGERQNLDCKKCLPF